MAVVKEGVYDPLYDDFRNFLYVVWKHLGLPDPTPAQYQLAYFLQHGFPEKLSERGRRDIIMAFRGVGKSWITAAYVLWRLYRDPVNEKILVVSASSLKAKEFVSQVKAVLMTLPILAHLRPRQDQRDMADRFDVNGASIAQSPSVKAVGITGQITGSRATCIVPDDVEVPENVKTEEGRLTLLNLTSEFESIIVPGGDIIYLGTPHTEESLYRKRVQEFGYNCLCWPARYPMPDKRIGYVLKLKDLDGRDTGMVVDILAPFLRDALEADPKLAGKPTDPERFDDLELIAREAKLGRSRFALQFMLDTSLSDANRYPLKAHDLIVTGVNTDKAPMTIQWGQDSDKKNVRNDIPNYGFTGDYCLGPLFATMDELRDYTGSVLFVDPSGRGEDETAWAVVKVLNGKFYVTTVGGHNGNVTEGMELVAKAGKTHKVNAIIVEPNFAPGVWIAAFQPILINIWPGNQKIVSRRNGVETVIGEGGGCMVEEAEWAKGQKEARIIDTLEPVLNSHRLIVDESVARDEVLMYQMTHITRERGALRHDDRIDALAGAIAHFEHVLMQDSKQQADAQREAELQAEAEQFVEDLLTQGTRSYRRGVRTIIKDGKVYRTIHRDVEVYQS